MMLPYWIDSALRATPAFLLVFFALGLPWALAALPRADWRDRPLIVGLGLALGPTLLTAWMFTLSTLGALNNGASLLRLEIVLAGIAILIAAGMALAWRKRRSPVAPAEPKSSLAADEKLLIALIAAAAVVQWFSGAYWPFMAYDALWVYGYQGRLYTLHGFIPDAIGYYPQFLPLLYTYGQLTVARIDDHAARAVLPFLNLGSVLAAYVLGSRLFSRRVGIFVAALWALYPHVGEWSRFGDLEIVLTFLFTLAAAFFLMAWQGGPDRRRYALIAGALLGAALWTKPTAGALIWGIALLVAAEAARTRLDWKALRPRLETAFLTGLAALPLGAVWYVRNALLGHRIIEFPTAFWLTQAARSGAEFGWPLLALLVALAYAFTHRSDLVFPLARVGTGLLLILVGLLPSIIQPHRMGLVEWSALAAGAALVGSSFLPIVRKSAKIHAAWGRVGAALLLAVPYFVTWFYSYSYHYRLSFPIVPLLALPSAVILAHWLAPLGWPWLRRSIYFFALLVLGAPGVFSALYDINAGWDWLWSGRMPDDTARYQSGNPALMTLVAGLQVYLDEQDAPLRVVAPGVRRLPFFFPGKDIRIDEAPTRLSQLEGVTYFVDSSPEGAGAYDGIPMQQNQIISALALAGSTVDNVMRRAWGADDGIFRYDVFELHLEQRFVEPDSFHDPAEPVVFGDFARFRGHGIGADTFWPGRPVYLQLYWEALRPAPRDYMIYIHLRDRNGNVRAAWDGPVGTSNDGRYYSTLLWEAGEYIRDERLLRLTGENPPPGDGYTIVIGMYDLAGEERVPVRIANQPPVDGFTLNERIKVLDAPPE